MKKTRKALSIVLSVLVVLASMPMMYTATIAAGTIDNPTTALEESNPFEYEDLYKLNIERSNNDFFFYQTIDDEYFVVEQDLSVQQYTVSLGSNRTLAFQSLGLYEGGSNAAETTGDAGVYEYPVIDVNATSEFKSKYYVSDSWASTNDNASGLDCTNSVNLEASGWDLNGSHKTYTWSHNTIFKGHSAGTSGTINTSFYERMIWNWVSDDSSASMDFRIKTSITVVDAREFVDALADAENVVANPSEYPEGYVSALQAVLKTIPESAKNLSVRYDQSELDSFANQIRSVKTNSANYTEYNYAYDYFSSMTNDEGIYSGQSFSAFKEKIEKINNALPKDLTLEDQAIVDQAVEDLKTAYKTILLTNATLTPGVTHTETIVDMTVSVGTEFNLIQVKDNQMFSLAQPWTISHEKSSARKFAVTLDVSDANTNTFISHLDPTSYGTQDFDNKALSQSGATVFTCWDELDENGNFKDSSDFLNEETRTINADYDGFKKGNTYYLQSTPIFYGKSSEQTDTDTAMQYFYTQNFYVGWSGTFGIGGSSGSSKFTTTINITDARGLLNAYNEAGVIINTEDSPYTDAYVAELEVAYNAVPKDMVQGLKYYDQATVNASTKSITDILDNPKYKADYSEYDKAVAEAESIIAAGNSEGVYEQGAFDEYVTNVGLVPVPDRTLSTDDQAIIDASTNQLKDLKEILEQNKYADYTELDAAKERAQAILDNSAAYSQETIDAVTQALAQANQVPANMVVGENNANQTTIDNAAAALNGVVDSAVPLDGDYTEYNNAKAEIDAILNASNADENGNPIYKEDVFTNATNYVTRIDTNLDKNLKADNQSTIDDATAALERAKTYLEQNKYADYTDFNAAKSEIENIVNNPDNYSDEVVDAANKVLEEANQIPADMVVGENNVNQDTIDAATDAMQDVIDSSKAKADYTDYNNAKSEADSLVNDDGNGNPIYNEDAFNAYKEAVDEVDTALNKELPAADQAIVDDATTALEDLKATLENNKLADYTDFNAAKDALEEIVNNPDKYTSETVENAQDALDEANKVPADMVVGENNVNQDTIDAATDAMQSVIDSAKEKADYSKLDDAYNAAQDIVNAPEGTYTEETVKNAQDAIDAADALNKDLEKNDENQAIIDEVVKNLEDSVTNAEEKADYTEFDKVVDALEEIVNAPEGTYTEETVKNAQDALDNIVAGTDKDLPSTEQDALDEITSNLQDVVDSAKEKADYTNYNNAKAEADSLVNDDGNGNPIYNEDAFNAYKDAVNSVDTALDKDLSDADQAIVDEATSDLADLKATLEDNKLADYTDFNAAKDALEEIVNNSGKYTSETVKNAQDALEEANKVPADMVVGENNANQDTIDAATDAMQSVIDSAKEKADYSKLDDAYNAAQDIVNAPEGTYTEETVKNAQDAIDAADALNKDLEKNDENQAIIDEVVKNLEDSVTNAEEKADYTEFDKVVDALEEIVNAPEGTYTEETVENAQDALDNIVAGTDKDLPVSEQPTLDEITSNLQDVVDSAEKKADYTEFDKVVDDLEEIVNAPEGTYTEETVKNAQDALDNIVAGTDKDLADTEQDVLDEITSNLQDVVDSAKEKADYTDYNNAKSEADSLVNDDGNGNPIYDEDAFNAYKDAVNSVDTALDKDLSKDDQTIVDDATTALEDLKVTLEEKKIYKVTFIGLNGEVLTEIEYVNGSVFGTIAAPELPESTDLIAYVGWLNAGVLMNAESVLTGNVVLTVAQEYKKFVSKAESSVSFGDEYVTGVNKNTTVSQFKAELENDEVTVEIRDYEGNLLADDALVGTGATITLKSKHTDVVYEVKTVIVYGDVDGDGDVDVDDRTKVSEVAVDNDSFDAEHPYFFLAADVCNDGYINALDGWMVNLIANEKREVLTVA